MREVVVLIILVLSLMLASFEAGYIYKGWQSEKYNVIATRHNEDIRSLQSRVTIIERRGK
jgi:hypothetical protein